MRVAAFLWAYPPDRLAGADLMSQSLLRALYRAGIQVTVYTMEKGAQRVDEGVEVIPGGFKTNLLRTVAADAIYVHADMPQMPTLHAYARARVLPIIAVAHNISARTAQSLRQRRPELKVWNSQATRAALKGTDGVICRPPLDVSANRVERVRLNAKSITLVNLSVNKGALLFWDLAERMPTYRFLGVVGGHGVQVTKHPRLGTMENVDVVGPVHPSRMREVVWARTRVLVAPSLMESWGMAASEALCSGIPVVAHPTPGLEESLGEVGVFVNRAEPEQWVQAIQAVWDEEPRKYEVRAGQIQAMHRDDLVTFVEAVRALSPV